MTVEQFAEVVKMLGLVTGGLWTAWTFQKLQKVRAAELANDQKRTQIRSARIEQQEIKTRLLRQQPQLAIQLGVSEEAFPKEPYKSLLCITVTLKNEGEQNLDVVFNPSSLTVAEMVFKKNGTPSLGRIHRFGGSYFMPESDEPQMFQERVLRSGQARKMALAVMPVAAPAVYVIQFDAIYVSRAYDGEEGRSRKDRVPIQAVEQAFFVATGRPNA